MSCKCSTDASSLECHVCPVLMACFLYLATATAQRRNYARTTRCSFGYMPGTERRYPHDTKKTLRRVTAGPCSGSFFVFRGRGGPARRGADRPAGNKQLSPPARFPALVPRHQPGATGALPQQNGQCQWPHVSYPGAAPGTALQFPQ